MQEDLRVEPLERVLELVLVADVDDELELGLLAVLVAGPDRERVGVRRLAAAAPEQRQRRRLADALDREIDRQRLRALLLGRPRGGGIGDVDDDRDPVALRDVVAQTSRSRHARTKRIRYSSISMPSYAGSQPSAAPSRRSSSCDMRSISSTWERIVRLAPSARAISSACA